MMVPLLLTCLLQLSVGHSFSSARSRNPYIYRMPVQTRGGMTGMRSLAREQGALLTEQFLGLQDNRCLDRGLCQLGAMNAAKQGGFQLPSALTEIELDITIAEAIEAIKENLGGVLQTVQGWANNDDDDDDDDAQRKFPTINRLMGAVKVGEMMGYESCKSLFDCSEDFFRTKQQGRMTCQGAGVICPGLSITCAMCGLYAPPTCAAACTGAGLYCGFGGYACADLALANAAEAAAPPAPAPAPTPAPTPPPRH